MTGYGQMLLYVGLGFPILVSLSWVIVYSLFTLISTPRASSAGLIVAIFPVISFLVVLDLLLRRAAHVSLERAAAWIDRNERGGSRK